MVRVEFQRARHEAGMTQRELAFECDVTETYIRQIENGRRNPSSKVMFKISQKLNRTPEVLFSDLYE